jgi:hypothetical protein
MKINEIKEYLLSYIYNNNSVKLSVSFFTQHHKYTLMVYGDHVLHHFQQYFNYIVVVSLVEKRTRSFTELLL